MSESQLERQSKQEINLQQGHNKQSYIDVLSSSVSAINALTNTVKATVGPKGLDVMLVDQYGDYTCTNDGVEILSHIELHHPAARLAVEVAKAQEFRAGDGTTTSMILTDSILSSALIRIQAGLSSTGISEGIKLAVKELKNQLTSQAKQINNINDCNLLNATKIAARGDGELSNLLITACRKLIENNAAEGLDFFVSDKFNLAASVYTAVQQESRILNGLFIKKKSHFEHQLPIKDTSILVIEGAFDPEAMPLEAIGTDEGVKEFKNNTQTLAEAAKKIVRAGVKAIFVDASLYPKIEEYFVKEGIFVLTQLKKSDLRKLAFAAGCKIINRQNLFSSSIDEIKPLTGTVKYIKEDKSLGGFIIAGNKYYQPSVLISAETPLLVRERERIAIDALRALQMTYQSGYVMGEGVAEINAIASLENFRDDFELKHNQFNPKRKIELLAGIDIIIESLNTLFTQIVDNAGFNSDEIFNKLLEAKKLSAESGDHGAGDKLGIDLDTAKVINIEEAGILDPVGLKINAFNIAADIACQILRTNLILQAKNV